MDRPELQVPRTATIESQVGSPDLQAEADTKTRVQIKPEAKQLTEHEQLYQNVESERPQPQEGQGGTRGISTEEGQGTSDY